MKYLELTNTIIITLGDYDLPYNIGGEVFALNIEKLREGIL